MTLQSSGAITMAEINTEFGYGLNLNAYRGQDYWTDAGTHTTFSAGAIDMADFYSTRIPKTVSYIGYIDTGTGTTTRTFGTFSFGTAATTRRLVAVFTGGDNTNLVASAVTIGGTSATIAIQENEGGNSTNPFACIAYATVPTGTSGSVAITLNGSPSTIYCALYALYDTVSQTPQDTASGTNSSSINLNLTIPANGFAIAAAAFISKTSVGWVGITEREDLGGSNAYAWGDTNTYGTTAQSPRTITATGGGGDNVCAVSACWY